MLTVPILAIVGDTEEEQAAMAKLVRAQMGFYGSTPAYAFQFDRLGLDGLGGQLNALLKQGDLEGQARLLTDEVLAHFVVTATWDDLPAALADRYAGGRRRSPGGLPGPADVAARPGHPRAVGRRRHAPADPQLGRLALGRHVRARPHGIEAGQLMRSRTCSSGTVATPMLASAMP